MTTSLSDIRPGDKVILRYSSTFVPDQIATVDRVTKTQIFIGGSGRRFRIRDGRESGYHGQWACFHIFPATPDEIVEVERHQQLKRDHQRACDLAEEIVEEVGTRDYASLSAAAAIPHLEAALAALN
ncbi:hypothetical protein [Synechococcus phage S-H1]|nr:hypothetical protein [Synechococcus phage S-H1]